jgi:RNA polymerase sigma factor (sigma-70 family)
MYTILRKTDSDLLSEAVNRVLLNLPAFRGDSLFTTWAHRILMSVMYDQRRLDRHRREVSLSIPGFDLPSESSPEVTDLLLTVQQALSSPDQTLFKELVLLGMTQEEAALNLGVSQQTISRKWERIKQVLQHALTQ